MPWRGPDAEGELPSLGWQLLDWLEQLPSPRDPSKPLRFTDEQALQLVQWFTIDPQRGKLVHRRGYSRRSKGWGKSPVEAAKVIAELAGPVRFAGWDSDGNPVGRPWGGPGDPQPWVQVGAVSEDQTDNTWSVVYYLLTENDGAAAADLGIDAGLTRCFLRNRPGAKLEPVTASAGSREGQPITYACLDETHLWTPRNGGVKLARTLRRNVAKMNGRSYETTNSFVRGEQSVAEGSHKAVQQGAAGVFSDEVEAPIAIDGDGIGPESPDEHLRRALKVAYGDSWWADIDRLVSDIRDPDSDWEDSCRFFFNWNRDAVEVVPDGPIPLADWDFIIDGGSTVVAETAVVAVDKDSEWYQASVVGERPDGLHHGGTLVANMNLTAFLAGLSEACAALGVSTVAVPKGSPAEAMTGDLSGVGLTPYVMPQHEQAMAFERFVNATKGAAPMLRHLGEPKVRKAIEQAATKPWGDGGETWSRRTTKGDISPLTALTMAYGRLGVDVDEAVFVSSVIGGS